MGKNNEEFNYKDLFSKTVSSFPNKVAIKSYSEKIMYRDLDLLITKIVTNLNSQIKDEKEIVATCSDGTIFQFATMVACIKTGIIFVNLDLNMPTNYLNGIVNDLNIKRVIISERSNSLYREKIKNFKMVISEDSLKIDTISTDTTRKNKTVFIVPTSGSTGTPKYVKKKMTALMKSYHQFKERVEFLFEKTIEQSAPLNFAFGLELSLIFLASGNTICINEKKDYTDLKYIYNNIEKNDVEIAFWPAPLIKLLSRQPKLIEDMPKGLKYIIVGGEPIVVSADLIFEFHKRDIKLMNNYGSTETGTMFFNSMDISLLEVEEFNLISVGQPLEGFKAVILNEELEPSKKGHLYIKANEFENEYYNLKQEQEKKFLKMKEYPNSILCETGDICEYKNGKYYIIGRNNNCINVKGYRVEIENIEFFVTKLLKGFECCIVPFVNSFNESNMVCFYSSKALDTIELRKQLEKEVPEYMVPKLFIQLEELYHLKNGKINRERMKKLYFDEYSATDKDNKELEDKIFNTLESVLGFKIKKSTKTLPLKELGLDSLGFTDFISLVESKEKVNIEDSVLPLLFEGMVEDITNYIIKKLR